MTAHSRIGASSMERWANCPGSVALCETLPEEPSSVYAAEGTEAHAYAERAITGNGWSTNNPELREAVQIYKDAIEALPTTERHVEVKVQLLELHPMLFGTAACVVWNAEERVLAVADFKYGAGMPVAVRDTRPLKYYAVGAMLRFDYRPRRVRTMVVQPRCPHPDGPVRTADYEAIELIDFAGEIIEAVRRVMAPDAPLVAGDWCRKSFCPARAVCPAVKALANEQMLRAFAPDTAYDPLLLADTLRKLPILEDWIKGVREFAYKEAEQGRTAPGYKLAAKRPTEHWRVDTTPEKVAEAFGLTVTDIVSTPELLSPAQVRKQVPGKNDKERAAALAVFTEKVSSGHALVPIDDPRPAIGESAALAFQGVE